MFSRWWEGSRQKTVALLVILLLSGASPRVAEAGCISEAIESCDRDFGTWYYKLLGLTWWCYAARAGWCELTESLQ